PRGDGLLRFEPPTEVVDVVERMCRERDVHLPIPSGDRPTGVEDLDVGCGRVLDGARQHLAHGGGRFDRDDLSDGTREGYREASTSSADIEPGIAWLREGLHERPFHGDVVARPEG